MSFSRGLDFLLLLAFSLLAASGLEYDVDIITNMREGRYLLDEVRSFQDNPALARDVKIFFNTSVDTWLSSNEQYRDCCIQRSPAQMITHKVTASGTCMERYNRLEIDYTCCGFICTRRCRENVYHASYRMSTCYLQKPVLLAKAAICPHNMQACCVGQVLWDDQRCIDIDKLREYLSNIQATLDSEGEAAEKEL